MKNFGNVERKLQESEFFLEKLYREAMHPILANHYLSAFVSAARSVTFTIQYNTSEIEGFKSWYEKRQADLKKDPYAKLFLEIRNCMIHEGQVPICYSESATDQQGRKYYRHYLGAQLVIPEASNHIEQTRSVFIFLNDPQHSGEDLHTQARKYFTLLVSVIYEFYIEFGSIIDPNQYYTLANLRTLNLNIEDIEEELGFKRGWTKISEDILPWYLQQEGISKDEFLENEDAIRLQAIKRDLANTGMYTMFEEYLGKERVSSLHEKVLKMMEPS